MATASAVSTEPELRDHVAAGAIITSHTLQHLYGHAFWVILPTIYAAMGPQPDNGGANRDCAHGRQRSLPQRWAASL